MPGTTISPVEFARNRLVDCDLTCLQGPSWLTLKSTASCRSLDPLYWPFSFVSSATQVSSNQDHLPSGSVTCRELKSLSCYPLPRIEAQDFASVMPSGIILAIRWQDLVPCKLKDQPQGVIESKTGATVALIPNVCRRVLT